MFDAEELFRKKPLGYEMKPELEIYTDGFKDGYNKAKEEMQKNGLALQSDMDKTIEQNIQLKKQNNWLEGCKLELAEHLGKANDKISELKAQIEKIKCCEMCKHKNFNWWFSPICEARDKIKIENPLTCKCDKWEIKEND